MELEFGTLKGLEQYVWERFPGGIVRDDVWIVEAERQLELRQEGIPVRPKAW